MNPHRLTLTIYILLLIAISLSIAFNAIGIFNTAWLAENGLATMVRFGLSSSKTINGVLVEENFIGVHMSYFPLPFTLVALALIYLKRKDMTIYFADHMQWQRNTVFAYFMMIILLMVFGIFVLYIPAMVLFVVAQGWFLYRMLRGTYCLLKGQSVYFNGAPLN